MMADTVAHNCPSDEQLDSVRRKLLRDWLFFLGKKTLSNCLSTGQSCVKVSAMISNDVGKDVVALQHREPGVSCHCSR